MRAVLVRCCVMLLLVLLGPAQAAAKVPQAQGGSLDLSQWDFPRDGIVSLDGQWQFVPGRFVGPEEPWPTSSHALAVPGPWNEVAGHGHGFGTYRLQLR